MDPLCTCRRDPQTRKSLEIERALKEDFEKENNIIKLLLLGTGESGKSTFVKQMRIINTLGFGEKERKTRIADIRRNLHESILCLVRANAKNGMNLTDPRTQESFDFILNFQPLERVHSEYHELEPLAEWPQEFYDHASVLWNEPEIQATFRKSHEFQLLDSAKYYLDRIDQIRSESYIPDDQDILRCRIMTTQIQKTEFEIKLSILEGGGTVKIHLFDVGGQKGERRKWIQVFDRVTAIIFLVACSDFCLRLREDSTTNRLLEAEVTFDLVWNNRFLKTRSVILFLNKQDLLKESIDHGVSLDHFPECFPDFADYDCSAVVSPQSEDYDYQRARMYIKDRFAKIVQKPHLDSAGGVVKDWHLNHNCFQHFTVATDTENIKRVFETCKNIVIQQHLRDLNLS